MPFTPETAHTGTQFKPGQSGNLAGKPKGTKHLSTWIQELMNDEKFEAQILEGYKIVEYKGAPIKAIIRVQMLKALAGDVKAFEALSKYGYGAKLDLTTNGKDLPTPILGGEIVEGEVIDDVKSEDLEN